MSGEAGRAPGERPTPFALALPDSRWIETRFAAIEAEARSRAMDLDDPAKFLLLASVGASLQDLRPEEGETSPELFHAFGQFLFHAFHLFRGTSPGMLLEVERGAARYLVEAGPMLEGWDGSLPAPAGYLRLPPNLFWTRPSGESAPAEPVDGISWYLASHLTPDPRGADDAPRPATDDAPRPVADEEGPSGLALLVITGMRGDRPGFSVLPLPVVPMTDVRAWLGRKARPDGAGEDFQTTLPGGELGNLYSVDTTGEVLKLFARAFGYAMTTPGAMLDPAEGPPGVTPLPGDPSIDAGLSVATLRLIGPK